MPIVVLIPGGGSAVVGYTAQGVHFDGTATMHRAGALTGVTDSKIGLLSCWFRGNVASDGSIFFTLTLQAGVASGQVIRLANNTMRFIFEDSAGTNILFAVTTATFAAADGWKHVVASWNLATATIQMYVEDVSDCSIIVNTNSTIDYATNVTDWQFPDVGLPGAFDVADFWFDPNQVLDLSVTANRRKFISAGLAPVDLGAAGATPTGTSPAVFFSGAAASWNTNKGTGGGFTITAGSITAASNPP